MIITRCRRVFGSGGQLAAARTDGPVCGVMDVRGDRLAAVHDLRGPLTGGPSIA